MSLTDEEMELIAARGRCKCGHLLVLHGDAWDLYDCRCEQCPCTDYVNESERFDVSRPYGPPTPVECIRDPWERSIRRSELDMEKYFDQMLVYRTTNYKGPVAFNVVKR